jgi:hypothetical protein
MLFQNLCLKVSPFTLTNRPDSGHLGSYIQPADPAEQG